MPPCDPSLPAVSVALGDEDWECKFSDVGELEVENWPWKSLKRLGCLCSVEGMTVVNAPALTSTRALRLAPSWPGDIVVTDAPVLDDLEAFADVTWAEEVTLRRVGLRDLRGLGSLGRLTGDLTIESAPRLASLSGLAKGAWVYRVFVRDAPALVHVDWHLRAAAWITFEHVGLLDFRGMETMQELPDVSVLDAPDLHSLAGLPELGDVTVTLEEVPSLVTLDGIAAGVTHLWVSDAESLVDVAGASEAAALSGLIVEGAPQLRSLVDLGKPGSPLRGVGVGDVPALGSLAGLDAVPGLQGLWVGGRTGFTDLTGLGDASRLRVVWLDDASDMVSFAGAETATTLDALYVTGRTPADLRGLDSLSYVADARLETPSLVGLENLAAVGVLDAWGAASAEGLEGLRAGEVTLKFSADPPLEDLSPLAGLREGWLWVGGDVTWAACVALDAQLVQNGAALDFFSCQAVDGEHIFGY